MRKAQEPTHGCSEIDVAREDKGEMEHSETGNEEK